MNRITELFNIKYPIIQGGMVWCSGWKLAAAVSNAGGLGVIGSGSMTPELLTEHIKKCKNATNNSFGVNIPLIFNYSNEFIDIVIKEKVPVVITSAGNPAKYTNKLKSKGIVVAHVVANKKAALKCEKEGVDAIIAEGVEAGGHNGKEETTSMVLIPMISEITSLPLIAAGGISSGKSMLAAFALGAEAVQIGSRFVACNESSANEKFINEVLSADDGDTILTLKSLISVRLLKNKFANEITEMEKNGASQQELLEKLGSGRPEQGMFLGDIDNGELEIGQAATIINKKMAAKDIIDEIISEFNSKADKIQKL